MDKNQAGAAPISGVDVIRDNLTRLPSKPGVYRMFGDLDEVLYVGKARDLKARVSNYTRMGGHTQRIARMISQTRRMEFVVTESETEALLLEANLVKSLKPRFNVLLRDDKSFAEILIRRDHEAPQIASIAAPSTTKATISAPSPRPGR
jgi:excinuclease ABC subunit C